MATCHSLRLVDNRLVGDPLDFKMFDFTGWSFEEGGQKLASTENEEQGNIMPSIARPPPGMEYDLDGSDHPESVSTYTSSSKPVANTSR